MPDVLTRTADMIEELLFETESCLGRWLRMDRLPEAPEPRLLNLGCGVLRFDGWVNADFFGGFKPWKRATRPDWMLDLRRPLRCPDNHWDGIFMEHVLEHLPSVAATALLAELHRVLRPGGWARISVPDLGKYVGFYRDPASADPNFRQWRGGAEALESVALGFGHRSLWDRARLTRSLAEAGFVSVSEREFQQGSDSRLLKDHPERRWETLYVEGQKASPRR